MRNFPLQEVSLELHPGVGLQSDRVGKMLCFEEGVQLGDGKRGVAAKELRDVQVAIPLDHRQQHPPPVFGAGLVAAP